MPWTRPLAALALLSTSLLAGCGDDNDAPIVPLVPTVQIQSLTPSFGAGWTFMPDGPPATLVMPCDGQVAVGVSVDDTDSDPTTKFGLKPPGGCGGAVSCGHVIVTTSIATVMEPTDQMEGALFTPALFTLDPSFSGPGTFTATVVYDDGSPYLDEQMAVIAHSLEVSFEAAVGCE